MTCPTCNGSGYVMGDWSSELCPACSGRRAYVSPNEPDRTIPWWLVVALVVPIALGIAIQWGMWSLIVAVSV